jgi:TonB family protein
MRVLALTAVALGLGCRGGDGGGQPGASEGGETAFQPPVATNAETPIAYPAALFADGIEGTVVLRLFVDESGNVVPDSTVIAEGSGYPALDSAALAGVPQLRFAPARREGTPVATTVLQPVQFRLPDGGGSERE